MRMRRLLKTTNVGLVGARVATVEPMLIETLINLKMAELEALACLLNRPPRSIRAEALAHPDKWVERLAELTLLAEYAGRLEDGYRALVRSGRRP